ncbi:hypothetical protein K0U00_00165 [Paenibacillus sepulcri]|uniref:Uncharacterized protein n=1 Tax=Paenibacillus sepulcri TaxID=359917 RepID=A0ABS7BUX6_9BACL|nr:hypothetical protein [Paenibacillus sepulcri]
MTTMKSSQEIMDELEKSKGKYRSIVQAGIAKWVKDFQEGSIKINSVDDLKKLIEMDIQILKDDLVQLKHNESVPRKGTRKGGGGSET